MTRVAPVVVLSPHLDDAVLSCWHLLQGHGEVTVINVFTASPPAGTPVPEWDRLTGTRDPVRRMEERRAEDRLALSRAGRAGQALGLLDAQYRHEALTASAVTAAIARLLAPNSVLHAPAALGGHPDHGLVRDAALELMHSGHDLVLYADLPHCITRGWPGWVTGAIEPEEAAIGEDWAGVLAAAGLDVSGLIPCVQTLDASDRERKLRALAAYATQRKGLDAMAFVPLGNPQALAFEVGWRVPRSALCGGTDEARGECGVLHAGGQPLHDGDRGGPQLRGLSHRAEPGKRRQGLPPGAGQTVPV